MYRISALRTVALVSTALSLLAAAGPLAAQTVPRDSAELASPPVHRLAPIVVTAPAPHESFFDRFGRRHRITALQRENRALALQLVRYDRQIVRLEAKLHHLQTVVTDSLVRNIASLDSATVVTRAERIRLEKKLRSLESAAIVAPR